MVALTALLFNAAPLIPEGTMHFATPRRLCSWQKIATLQCYPPAMDMPWPVSRASNVLLPWAEACGSIPKLRCSLFHRNVLARTALVGELASKGVGNLVPDDIKQILTLLEGDFVPLELCHRLQPLLQSLGSLSKPMSGECCKSNCTL